jgi:phage-related protein
MQFLDESAEVATWEYESFKIEYVSNKKSGRVRKYIPDFRVTFVDGTISIVEIKPSKRLVQATVKKKIVAAEEWCALNNCKFKVVTEHELKNLGLL